MYSKEKIKRIEKTMGAAYPYDLRKQVMKLIEKYIIGKNYKKKQKL
nr:hypothetical protein [Orientia tsutsugamushi]